MAIVLLLANGAALILRVLQTAADPLVPAPPLVHDVPAVALLVDGPGSVASDGFRCYTLGPLATLAQQQRAEDRLRLFADQLRPRSTQADRDRGWWVFIAAPSRSAAIELARDLADRGVEDYFVVADANRPEAVSLGLYEQLDNARRRLAQIRAMGFDAQLMIRREEIPQFWIDYRIDSDQHSPWRFILRASPGAVHFEIPCFS